MRGWKAREQAAKQRRIKTKISPEARVERKALYDATKAINARGDEHYDDPHKDPVAADADEANDRVTVRDAKRPKTVSLRGSGKNKRVVTSDTPTDGASTPADEPEPQQDSDGALIET